jgi:hypothetical protein
VLAAAYCRILHVAFDAWNLKVMFRRLDVVFLKVLEQCLNELIIEYECINSIRSTVLQILFLLYICEFFSNIVLSSRLLPTHLWSIMHPYINLRVLRGVHRITVALRAKILQVIKLLRFYRFCSY